MRGRELELSRRELIKLFGVGATSIYFGGCSSISNATNNYNTAPLRKLSSQDLIAECGPFERGLSVPAPLLFSGDTNPKRAHQVLWDKKKFLVEHGGLPKPTETTDVVIVGGGMSGMLSAYNLRDLKPVILEQAPRFGGNSRGESWNRIDYSLATAYFGVPKPGSAIYRFFEEVGLKNGYRVRKGSDPIFIDGKRYDDVWTNGTNPESKVQFVKLDQHFTKMLAGEGGLSYPDVPITDETQRQYILGLDRITFKDYVEKVVGGALHPHVEQVIEHYFWSACAASYSEFSAAGGLNFFVGDYDGVAITPGGNGAIVEATMKTLSQTLPSENFRSSCLVFDVRTDKTGAVVSYMDVDGSLKAIRAKAVVMSCPKFVVEHLIDDLESDRKALIKKLRYHSYLVANILVNRPIPDDFYDLFFFSKNNMTIQGLEKSAKDQMATDIVYGNYPKPDTKRTVLTMFRGFPYDGPRHDLYKDGAYDKYRAEFLTQINDTVLPMMKIQKSEVADVRIARWGHPLPVTEKGFIASGSVDILRKPYNDRVFFVEQDNWMLPAFEVCFNEADHFAPLVRKFVKS